MGEAKLIEDVGVDGGDLGYHDTRLTDARMMSAKMMLGP